MPRKPIGLTLTAAAIAALAFPAKAAPDAVCKALRDLAADTARAVQPAVVNYSNSEFVGADGFSACWPVEQEAARAFCGVIVHAGGMHGLHRLPVWIAECAAKAGYHPRLERVAPTPWGPTVRRVDADLPRSLRVEVTFKPDPDRPRSPELGEAYGTYKLVIRRR